jgi:hypothetical protein
MVPVRWVAAAAAVLVTFGAGVWTGARWKGSSASVGPVTGSLASDGGVPEARASSSSGGCGADAGVRLTLSCPLPPPCHCPNTRPGAAPVIAAELEHHQEEPELPVVTATCEAAASSSSGPATASADAPLLPPVVVTVHDPPPGWWSVGLGTDASWVTPPAPSGVQTTSAVPGPTLQIRPMVSGTAYAGPLSFHLGVPIGKPWGGSLTVEVRPK